MTPGKIDIRRPNSENHFLWKYIDIHRLLYFLKEKKLFFTRLDKFDDPYEGVKTSFLRQDSFFSGVPDNPEEINPKLPLKERTRLANEKKLFEYIKKEEIGRTQKSQFISCWFYGERESMAMWNLYSSKESVVIKVDFDELYKSLQTSFAKFIEDNGNRVMIVGDRMTYLKLNPFDLNLPIIKLDYSGLKKDQSYAHEKEYRFLIAMEDKWAAEVDIPFFEIPIDNFSICKFSIVAHPNMENWKLNNIRNLVQIMNCSFEVTKSSTILRKSCG